MKGQQVRISVVREMYRLLGNHDAEAVKIARIGTSKKRGQTFARVKTCPCTWCADFKVDSIRSYLRIQIESAVSSIICLNKN